MGAGGADYYEQCGIASSNGQSWSITGATSLNPGVGCQMYCLTGYNLGTLTPSSIPSPTGMDLNFTPGCSPNCTGGGCLSGSVCSSVTLQQCEATAKMIRLWITLYTDKPLISRPAFKGVSLCKMARPQARVPVTVPQLVLILETAFPDAGLMMEVVILLFTFLLWNHAELPMSVRHSLRQSGFLTIEAVISMVLYAIIGIGIASSRPSFLGRHGQGP